jgi:hypothetical protein
MTTPITATSPTGATSPTRRWGIPLAFAGGAVAVALAGTAAFAGQTAAAADRLMVRAEHAEHAGHGPDRAMRMQARAEVDPAARGQHIADLAQRLGVDADELTATIEAFKADHEALREQLAELEPTERRDAMRAFADERRAAMAAALGVDVEVLAELHAETRDGAGHEHGPRGPQAGRMGPHARG